MTVHQQSSILMLELILIFIIGLKTAGHVQQFLRPNKRLGLLEHLKTRHSPYKDKKKSSHLRSCNQNTFALESLRTCVLFQHQLSYFTLDQSVGPTESLSSLQSGYKTALINELDDCSADDSQSGVSFGGQICREEPAVLIRLSGCDRKETKRFRMNLLDGAADGGREEAGGPQPFML